ncbi:XshC-Cox1-family protein [Acidaminobacter sp. JC074]|uniref:XdhC family protein n=1 Tax=Acidaminobacter sp. JC074 TaxID=2530199 RepID=UPI001F0D52EB|nr:XdhC/CoxI family protein [Acidaminobacter sp. JC074]MCH4887799.1 XshC-Cox1-family protein [Acidaminobacter sp. JC074]
MMDQILIKKLGKYLEDHNEVALVTVTSKAGSSPRDTGSMMIVDKSGNLLDGTIGGGGIEEQAKKDAAKCLKHNLSKSFHYELTLKDTKDSLHMACGGVMEVFVKVFKNRDQLIIFGGGHIGLDLCDFGKRLGYEVTVLDERKDYANTERFPNADRVLAGKLDDLMKEVTIDEKTSVVIVTHGHEHDLDAMRLVVGKGARYVGTIGSHSKIRHCFSVLLEEGTSQEDIDKIYGPIGIDIGGETPSEIALSIMAEIQAVKFHKKALFLKDTLEA